MGAKTIYIFLLGAIVSVLYSCSPVKRVLTNPKYYAQVKKQVILNGECVNDTITEEILKDTSDSPTAKPKVIQSDSLFFRVPNSLQVDPRAHSIRTDAFALGGAENILVCIESGQANISLSSTANVLVQGQGSHSVNLSGSAASVLASLTSGRGVTAASSGKVAGANLTFRVAAVSKASVEPELCNDAKITRSVGIPALGIDLNTVKVPVKIGKK